MDITVYFCPAQKEKSRSLLMQAASCYAKKDMSKEQLVFGFRGKPAFACGQPHFNISHSGGWWLAAFANAPLGADLQLHQPRADLLLISRSFHPLEQEYFRENPQLFYQLWTAKESWLKFCGQGIGGAMKSFSVVDEQGNFPSLAGENKDKGVFRFLPWQEKNYSFCLCAKEIGQVRLLPLF